MTSTSVKDVGSAFANLFAGSAQTVNTPSGAASFKQVLDNQVDKESNVSEMEVQTKPEEKNADAEVEVSETDSRMEKPEKPVEDVGKEAEIEAGTTVEKEAPTTAEADTSGNENPEFSEEEMAAMMEVLNTVATQLMQNVAETFDVTMEELQTVMKELEMVETDVLDSNKLGELMLQLGGASDSYALVTDEVLYDKYCMVMDAQKVALETVAQDLGVEQQQLDALISVEVQPEPVILEEVPDEVSVDISQQMVVTDEAADVEVTVETAEEVPEEMPVVEKTEQPKQPEYAEQNTGEKDTAAGQDGRERASEAPPVKQTNEFVAQNVTVENLQSQVQQTESIYSGATWDTDTQNIMRQIMDYMRIQVDAETTNLEMQLHPASLGTIRVNIASNGGVVTANFVTENETVKAALESQMVQLRETFAEQGVKIEAIEVTVQTHAFEQNLEQGRGRESQESDSKRNRTRRINLNDPLAMENMDEEDALVAEMLTAGGSTVDYTA